MSFVEVYVLPLQLAAFVAGWTAAMVTGVFFKAVL